MPDPSSKLGPGGFESSTDDRLMVALDAIIRSRFPALAFAGVYEYAVQSVGATTVRLLPTASGLPAPMLPPVSFPVAAYIPLTDALAPGTTCLVAFVNCDPARPVILARAGDTVRINAADITAAGLTSATGGLVTIGTAGATLHGRIGVGG